MVVKIGTNNTLDGENDIGHFESCRKEKRRIRSENSPLYIDYSFCIAISKTMCKNYSVLVTISYNILYIEFLDG